MYCLLLLLFNLDGGGSVCSSNMLVNLWLCLLLGLLFDPEDGGNMLLQNVSNLYQTTQHNIPEVSTLQSF
jgi:hypothetical protein